MNQSFSRCNDIQRTVAAELLQSGCNELIVSGFTLAPVKLKELFDHMQRVRPAKLDEPVEIESASVAVEISN